MKLCHSTRKNDNSIVVVVVVKMFGKMCNSQKFPSNHYQVIIIIIIADIQSSGKVSIFPNKMIGTEQDDNRRNAAIYAFNRRCSRSTRQKKNKTDKIIPKQKCIERKNYCQTLSVSFSYYTYTHHHQEEQQQR